MLLIHTNDKIKYSDVLNEIGFNNQKQIYTLMNDDINIEEFDVYNLDFFVETRLLLECKYLRAGCLRFISKLEQYDL